MKPEPSNRRDFLKGGWRRLDASAGGAASSSCPAAGLDGGAAARSDAAGEYLEQFSTAAMGCQFEILVPARRYPNAAQAALAVFDELERLEDIMSVYRPDSELSQLNAAPTGVWRGVSDELFDVLTMAQDLSSLTDGAFDVTARPLSNVWGFSQRAGRIPDEQELRHALSVVGYRHLELDENRRAVRKGKDLLTIDLGAIGKGYAVDRGRALLKEFGIEHAVIHGGQSSVTALGSESPPPANAAQVDAVSADKPGWKIGISHPLIPNHRLGVVRLAQRALGTSGSGRQGFVHQGRRYGHVIDPRTGQPPDHFLSVTVIAASSAEADALATGFFVMLPEEIQSICRARPDLGVILVHRPQTGAALRVESYNLEQDDWIPNDGAQALHRQRKHDANQ